MPAPKNTDLTKEPITLELGDIIEVKTGKGKGITKFRIYENVSELDPITLNTTIGFKRIN